MKILFVILSLMTISSVFGVYPDGTVEIDLESGIATSVDVPGKN